MRAVTFRQLRHRWGLYLLILPAIALIGIFEYYPAVSAVYHAFFRWNGDDISEYIGWDNFDRAFHDKVLGTSFYLVAILIVANFIKMVPSIITAVVIHRLASERWRYLYRVAFVIPMIIPDMVWLLIWKYFYDPTVGVLNAVLNIGVTVGGTEFSLMGCLQWLDSSTGLPAVSLALSPLTYGIVAMLAVGIVLWIVGARNENGYKWVGAVLTILASVLLLGIFAWPAPTGAFSTGAPSWLGQADLLIPALIFWGFPWVGVVSVLLYLAGLGNIGQDVYDAAEIDGCGWFRKFWNIELPLILTQVRLNLILMIIGTLQGWGLIFILLGDSGGPNGVGMVPGLYMFRKAFTDMEAGYGVAIGLLLFALTLGLTVINNRYVRVQK